MTAIQIHAPIGTDDDPAMETKHPAWCTFKHQADEPHESQAFAIHAVDQTHIALIDQHPGKDPRIVLETVTGNGQPFVNRFTFTEADELTDALLELRCIGGMCDCNGDTLCPGSPGHLSSGDPVVYSNPHTGQDETGWVYDGPDRSTPQTVSEALVKLRWVGSDRAMNAHSVNRAHITRTATDHANTR